MKNWETTIVELESTIFDAIQAIDRGGSQVAIVTDKHQRLNGVVTDGDVRRAILKGMQLSEPVSKIMKKDCVLAPVGTEQEQLFELLRARGIRAVPLVDSQRKVCGVAHIDDFLLTDSVKPNPVVIMAGGLGTRLRPLTETLPKPMLRVGGRPMLEIILDNFVSQGFKNFFISINYLGHIIQEHFGDGSKFGVSITYLSESKRLGTAGALSLLPEGITENIVVTNGDVLTRLNLRALLDFHNALHSSATICVREFSTQVPYGVVEVADQVVQKIEEKPNVQRLVNAGIYVLNPKLLSQIPKDTYIDMPDLLNSMLKKDQVIGAFPIREYWADIGRVTDLDNANLEFNPSGVEF